MRDPATVDVFIGRRQRDRIEELEEEVRQLRELLAPRLAFPPEMRLTPMESKILSAVYIRSPAVVTREFIIAAVYPDADRAPVTDSISVTVSKLRGKLRAFGVALGAKWGEGLYMDKPSAAIISAMIAGAPPP